MSNERCVACGTDGEVCIAAVQLKGVSEQVGEKVEHSVMEPEVILEAIRDTKSKFLENTEDEDNCISTEILKSAIKDAEEIFLEKWVNMKIRSTTPGHAKEDGSLDPDLIDEEIINKVLMLRDAPNREVYQGYEDDMTRNGLEALLDRFRGREEVIERNLEHAPRLKKLYEETYLE